MIENIRVQAGSKLCNLNRVQLGLSFLTALVYGLVNILHLTARTRLIMMMSNLIV